MKEKELDDKSNISNLSKSSDLNTNLKPLATKAELWADQDKIINTWFKLFFW